MTTVDRQPDAPRRTRKSAGASREMSIQVPWPEPITYSEHELKLIRGTYELMTRVGAQQLSLRYTARELGVSPGLLKYHFGDQDRLLIETMRWALQETLRRTRHSLEGLTDPEAALIALLDEVFLNPKRFRELQLISLDLAQYAGRHPEFSELGTLINTQALLYTAIIQAGVDSGVFHVADVEVAVFQVRGLVLGCGQQWIQHTDWATSLDTIRANCQQAIFMILKGSRAGS